MGGGGYAMASSEGGEMVVVVEVSMDNLVLCGRGDLVVGLNMVG